MLLYLSFSTDERDLALLRELRKHLVPLAQRGVAVRCSLDLPAGGDDRGQRLEWLAAADCVVLGVSADYQASDPCQDEAREALAQRRRGAAVVPLRLRAVVSGDLLGAELTVLPADGRPLSQWPSLDDALQHVAQALERLLQGLPPRRDAAELPPPAAAYHRSHYVAQPAIERRIVNRLRSPGAAVALQGPWGFGKATLVSHLLSDPSVGTAVRLNLSSLAAPPSDLRALLRWCGERLLAAVLPTRAELLDQAFARPGTDQASLEWLLHEHLLPRCQRLTLCIERAECLHRQRHETDFFTLLRSFVEQSKRGAPWNRLRLLMTVATEPVLLLDTIDHSGLFRDANPIELQPLTPVQVAEMARPYGIAADDPGLRAVSERCGGYPFLVRLWLYEAATREEPLAQVSESEVFASHLRGLGRALGQAALWPALRRVLDGQAPDNDDYLRLYSRGVVYQATDGRYRLRCPLYQDFISAALARAGGPSG